MKPLIHNQQRCLPFLDVAIDNEYQLFGHQDHRQKARNGLKMLITKRRRNVNQGRYLG